MNWKDKLKSIVCASNPEPTDHVLTADTAITVLGEFIAILSKVDGQCEFNLQQVHKTEDETQDMLHEIELTNFNAVRGYWLAKEVQKIRKDRRYYKDENSVMEYLVAYLQSNPEFKHSLELVYESMKNKQKTQQVRSYQPKVRQDLTIAGGATL